MFNSMRPLTTMKSYTHCALLPVMWVIWEFESQTQIFLPCLNLFNITFHLK